MVMRFFIVLAGVMMMTISPVLAAEKTAVFAGGCFWCMESEFKDIDGIKSVISGYAGGKEENPTYEQVSSGQTGHRESVQITYDPDKVSYEKLLGIFWDNVDPFDEEGQFCDKGFQYTSAIFVNDAAERALAEASVKQIEEKHAKKVATAVVDAAPFYAAEDYHQDYSDKNPLRYKYYRSRCGRDERLDDLKAGE